MDILVRPLVSSYKTSWQVLIGRHRVTFRNEKEATEFVAALEKRLSAEHVLPQTALRNLAAG
ncbi:hypothetical protein [Azomonas macrocytogenes]|uniref:Uncharacterized protein n=1 Tax=Azomonas macrocytogenes TaxID=69962 RepID=A0A839T080_AZOMA|nr:hypothetical protein [Azomonas macrocytogenes]MBB3102389.1 hypothetical protein [Azomonas macrocytogenes]